MDTHARDPWVSFDWQHLLEIFVSFENYSRMKDHKKPQSLLALTLSA
mgnify:CR=1 FL=1